MRTRAAGLSSAVHGEAGKIKPLSCLTGGGAAAPAGNLGSGGANGEARPLCVTTTEQRGVNKHRAVDFHQPRDARAEGSLSSSRLPAGHGPGS